MLIRIEFNSLEVKLVKKYRFLSCQMGLNIFRREGTKNLLEFNIVIIIINVIYVCYLILEFYYFQAMNYVLLLQIRVAFRAAGPVAGSRREARTRSGFITGPSPPKEPAGTTTGTSSSSKTRKF